MYSASRVLLAALMVFTSSLLAAAGSLKDAPVARDWTGAYVGLNLGYSWGESDTDHDFFNETTGALVSSSRTSFDLDGWVGGAQIGYAKQLAGGIILGLEADFQGTGEDGDTATSCTPVGDCNSLTAGAGTGIAPTASISQDLQWFGTVRARAGMLVTPDIVTYVTGGWAFGSVKTEGTLRGYDAFNNVVSQSFQNTQTLSGWVIGGGIEGRLSAKWTAKLEYLYVDLGSAKGSAAFTTNFPPLRYTYDSDITDQILRVGVNYRF